MVKNPSAQSRRHRFHPWVRKIPWRRDWKPTPVFLPWEILRTEEPGGLKSMGLQKSWSQLSDWTASPSYKDLHSFWLFSTLSPSCPLRSICLVFNWLHQSYFYFYFVKYINVDIFAVQARVFSLSSYLCLILHLCLTLHSPMDYSWPGFSVHGIISMRILEWVVIYSSRESSLLRDQTLISCIDTCVC